MGYSAQATGCATSAEEASVAAALVAMRYTGQPLPYQLRTTAAEEAESSWRSEAFAFAPGFLP
ncbi:hypothetical protein J22TS3_27940 [Paenibacillus sp. J22TS3]|nr:hypothetical protein J22TS3_27940 [Paenibacillus sp. J22TS3]